MPYLVHRLHLCCFTEGGIKRTRSCWVRPWLSFSYCNFKLFDSLIHDRLIYLQFDSLIHDRLIYLQLERAGNVVRAWYELLGLCEDVART